MQDDRLQELKSELERRRMLKSELERRRSMNAPQQEKGMLETLGFTGGKPQGIGDILRQDINIPENSPGIRGIQGAQDAIRELMTLGMVPIKPQAQGTAYNVGKGIGNVAGFLGGGELADIARLGAGASKIGQIPGIKKGLGFLENSPAIKRILGAGAFGAAENPEDRLRGAELGAGLGAGGEALATGIKAAPQLLESFKPNKYAEEILKNLGKSSLKGENIETGIGEESNALSRNSKETAKDISNKYKELKEIGSGKYDVALGGTDSVGSRVMEIRPKGKELEEIKSSLFTPKVLNTFDKKTSDLLEDFANNPTVKNAHEFQSQLGYKIRDLEKQDASKGLSIADKKILDRYKEGQNTIKGLIQKELEQAGEQSGKNYLEPYLEANRFHYENVVPFRHPLVSKIAKGEVKFPRNISNIFKNPEEDIQKIVEHLGPEFKNKIIFSELGKLKGKGLTSDKLLKAKEELDKKGLTEYITPELQEQFEHLGKKGKNLEIAKRIGGAVGGLGLGSLFPGSLGKELGAIGGYALAPAIEKLIQALSKGK